MAPSQMYLTTWEGKKKREKRKLRTATKMKGGRGKCLTTKHPTQRQREFTDRVISGRLSQQIFRYIGTIGH